MIKDSKSFCKFLEWFNNKFHLNFGRQFMQTSMQYFRFIYLFIENLTFKIEQNLYTKTSQKIWM